MPAMQGRRFAGQVGLKASKTAMLACVRHDKQIAPGETAADPAFARQDDSEMQPSCFSPRRGNPSRIVQNLDAAAILPTGSGQQE